MELKGSRNSVQTGIELAVTLTSSQDKRKFTFPGITVLLSQEWEVNNSTPKPHSADGWPKLSSGHCTIGFCPNFWKLGFLTLIIFYNLIICEKGKNSVLLTIKWSLSFFSHNISKIHKINEILDPETKIYLGDNQRKHSEGVEKGDGEGKRASHGHTGYCCMQLALPAGGF